MARDHLPLSTLLLSALGALLLGACDGGPGGSECSAQLLEGTDDSGEPVSVWVANRRPSVPWFPDGVSEVTLGMFDQSCGVHPDCDDRADASPLDQGFKVTFHAGGNLELFLGGEPRSFDWGIEVGETCSEIACDDLDVDPGVAWTYQLWLGAMDDGRYEVARGSVTVGLRNGESGWDGSIMGDRMAAAIPDFQDAVNWQFTRQNIEDDDDYFRDLPSEQEGCPD